MHQCFSNLDQLDHQEADNFFLISGPCAIEGRDMAFDIATEIKELAARYKIPYIFKASYRKANRSSLNSFTGIGDEKALKIIRDIREQLNLPTTTDIHTDEEAVIAARSVDVLQIPAFLCRQTNLLLAAGNTGKIVNIKKGQFLNAQAMGFAVEKVKSTNNPNVILTERGNNFGYQDMVVDFRGIPVMQSFKTPVVVDVTHSLQQPNQSSGVTGGRPEMIETIAKAAIAVGADGIFIETHPDPSKAKSDGANMLPLEQLDQLLQKLVSLRKALV